MYTYLLINFFTILFPFILSFDKKVNFSQYWKPLLPALLITAIIMILWDNYFALKGIWGFSKEYLIGTYFFSLPIEEILFFITVPYACIFTYESLKVYVEKDFLKDYSKSISIFLVVFLSILVLFHLKLTYTVVTSILLIIILISHLIKINSSYYLGRFYFAYLVCLIPFLIVNGLLTSGIKSISDNPVVWYNNAHNLSLRIFTIPVEDTVYCMFMLLLNITLFEYFKKKQKVELS